MIEYTHGARIIDDGRLELWVKAGDKTMAVWATDPMDAALVNAAADALVSQFSDSLKMKLIFDAHHALETVDGE